MGFYAHTVDIDFTIPADKVLAALDAVNNGVAEYATLVEAVAGVSDFKDNGDGSDDGEGGFSLGYHDDKWWGQTEELLYTLAPFAKEGSYVRLDGDEGPFGYRVVDGRLRTESGDYAWTLDD